MLLVAAFTLFVSWIRFFASLHSQRLDFILDICTCLFFVSLGVFFMAYKEEMNDKLAAMLTCYWGLHFFLTSITRKVQHSSVVPSHGINAVSI